MKYIITIIVIAVVAILSILLLKSSSPDREAHIFTPETKITHGHGLASVGEDLYIATHHGLLVLKNEVDLYRVGSARDDYMGFSAHPDEAGTFFSSGHPASGGNIGFQKSEDGGITWKKISNGGSAGPVDFHAMSVSDADVNVVYGWYQGNIHRSDDAGVSWTVMPTGFPVVHLTTDRSDAHVVYASSPLGFYRSKDAGASWEQLLDGFIATSALSPRGELFVVSETKGFAKSADNGMTWQRLDTDFQGETPLFISFGKDGLSSAHLLTEKNSVYKSVDNGMTWNKIR